MTWDETLFKNCNTEEDKIRKLKALLRRNGVQGEITTSKCRIAARKRIRDTVIIAPRGKNNFIIFFLNFDDDRR